MSRGAPTTGRRPTGALSGYSGSATTSACQGPGLPRGSLWITRHESSSIMMLTRRAKLILLQRGGGILGLRTTKASSVGGDCRALARARHAFATSARACSSGPPRSMLSWPVAMSRSPPRRTSPASHPAPATASARPSTAPESGSGRSPSRSLPSHRRADPGPAG